MKWSIFVNSEAIIRRVVEFIFEAGNYLIFYNKL